MFLRTMQILKPFHLPSLSGSMFNKSFWNKSVLNSVTELKQQINTAFGDLKQKEEEQKPTQAYH